MPKKPETSSGCPSLITTGNAYGRQETRSWNTLGQQEVTTPSGLFFKFFSCVACANTCACMRGHLWRSWGHWVLSSVSCIPLRQGFSLTRSLSCWLAGWLKRFWYPLFSIPNTGVTDTWSPDAGDLNSCLHACRSSSFTHWSIHLSSPKWSPWWRKLSLSFEIVMIAFVTLCPDCKLPDKEYFIQLFSTQCMLSGILTQLKCRLYKAAVSCFYTMPVCGTCLLCRTCSMHICWLGEYRSY